MAEPAVLTGKVCMITGATSGIGKAAALAMARLGPALILVGRDRERGEAAVGEIVRESGNREVELMLADFASQRQIRQLAKDFLGKQRPLHILFNNAGLVMLRRQEAEDGIETTFAVNHLGYFLLTQLLLERIKASAPARNSPSTILSMSPSASADVAEIGLPPVIKSSDAAMPASRGTRCVPPAPGNNPSFTSGSPTFALASAHR